MVGGGNGDGVESDRVLDVAGGHEYHQEESEDEYGDRRDGVGCCLDVEVAVLDHFVGCSEQVSFHYCIAE